MKFTNSSRILVGVLCLSTSSAWALKKPKDDKYLVDVVEKTDAVVAIKSAYGNCSKPEIRGEITKGHVHRKSVLYKCRSKKDGNVILQASTEISTWGKTKDITVQVLNIKGISNLAAD